MPKYKYSGRKAKAHPKGDYRTQKPHLGTARGGWRWLKVCEDFIGGQWEGFVSLPGKVYLTKAEALKHRPKW